MPVEAVLQAGAAGLAPARLRSEVERFGGVVDVLEGGTVTARFRAHDDDPERAVRAALALRELALDSGVALSAGVDTDEAGAARLLEAAPPNSVLVGEDAFRA